MDNPNKSIYRFQFSASGGEYFRIWIVNLFLTIITLGIYSAWAKVRRTRYFHGNIRVADTPFDYHGDPIKILKGRVIVVIFLGGFSLVDQLFPMLSPVFVLLFFALLPWIVIKSLAFYLHNTSWRTLRFHFVARWRDAVGTFYGWPTLFFFTAGLAYPLMKRSRVRFLVNHSRFVGAPFQLSPEATGGRFYLAYLKGALFTMVCAVLIRGGALLLQPKLAHISAHFSQNPTLMFFIPIGIGVGIGMFYLHALMTVLIFNHIQFAEHRLFTTMNPWVFTWIFISNFIGIVLTVGLFTPWATVRAMGYHLDHLHMEVVGDLDHFVADQQREVGALGESIGEVFEVDLGLA